MQLGEADFSMTEQAFTENPYDKGSERLYVQFHVHPKLNQTKTREAGRPIYDDTEYVTIIAPGDKDNIIDRPASEMDKRRFARQYDAFKRGQTDPVVTGTPLKMVPWISRGQAEELAYFHVYTVEQLAELSDANAQNFMGINTLKQKAKDFLAASTDTAFISQMREREQLQKMENDQLRTLVNQLNARLEALEAPKAV